MFQVLVEKSKWKYPEDYWIERYLPREVICSAVVELAILSTDLLEINEFIPTV